MYVAFPFVPGELQDLRGRFKVAVNCESLVNSDSALMDTAIFNLVKRNEKCFFYCPVAFN